MARGEPREGRNRCAHRAASAVVLEHEAGAIEDQGVVARTQNSSIALEDARRLVGAG